MVTAGYFVVCLIAFACLVWGVKLFSAYRDAAILLVLAPLTLLWYDSLMIGIGSFIGEGALLKNLSWPRYVAHALLLPAWIIAAGAIARRADLGWARPKWVMMLFCIVGTLGIALGVFELIKLELYPACVEGTLRYVSYVSDGQACRAGMEGLGERPAGPPIVPILATVLFIAVGLVLWAKRKWPWLFVGALFMFVMAAMPQSIAGPLLANFAEPFIAAGALLTLRHFLARKEKPAHQG